MCDGDIRVQMLEREVERLKMVVGLLEKAFLRGWSHDKYNQKKERAVSDLELLTNPTANTRGQRRR